MVEKLSATLFGMWNMGLSASVTPIAGSHCRIVVVVVFVVEIIYVVIFASLCLRHCHRWSVRPTDRRADHGSVCVVDLAGGTILGWSDIHPHLLTCDKTDGQNGWTSGCTMVKNSQEPRCKHWATRSSIRSFAGTTHLFNAPDCSLRSRPPLRSLVRSLTHSLANGKKVFCMK